MTVSAPAPSTHLPPIARIQTYSAEDLTKAVLYLRLIYNPDVCGSRRHGSREHSIPDPDLEALHSDVFERAYAIRWLTALVSRVYQLLEADEDAPRHVLTLEALLQQATALLAVCAGTASAGTVTRTFRFYGKAAPVEVQLTDAPLENQDYGSVGAQTWGSACLLAEMLVEDPAAFGLLPAAPCLRVLELGAGTGLVSVVLGKLLGVHASVVATDFHPSVLENLQNNVTANFAADSTLPVRTHVLDWAKFPALSDPPAPFEEPFDYIFGADVIYEAEHALWIKSCVEKLLRRPTPSNPRPAFHLVIPLRPTHTLESSLVEEIFPSIEACDTRATLLALSKTAIVCEANVCLRSRNGASEEVEYVHYVIGWRS
ncbi:putative methyltransferase-domain-containing protein [Fomitopsis betulina]|nr:putative methyltransferase-domain-containing protein [Fomitopsis betulina]